MGDYRLLFSVSLEHHYFSDGLCTVLEFVPSVQTKRFIEKTGLIVKNEGSGISLLYDTDKRDALNLYVGDIFDPSALCFKVFSRDRLFLNYTDLPPIKDDSILYFSNINSETGSLRQSLLHEGEVVSEKDVESIDSPEVKAHISARDRLMKPVCMVNIGLEFKKRSLISKWERNGHNRYVIRFANRKTFWKYLLLGAREKENLYIWDVNNGVIFDDPVDVRVADQRNAFSFMSRSSIPLQEQSVHHFQLKEKRAGNGKVVIRRLPVAASQHICKEKKTGSREEVTTSEIFINF